MSTGSQAIADTAFGLRQRSCKRAACSATFPILGSGLSGNCCEESCLVEVARRECKKKCGDESGNIENSSCDFVVTSRIDPDIKSNSQPCVSHYNKTRDRYGAILDNLGCICKVLLSLNLESCCVIPSHASVPLKYSTISEKSEASRKATRDLSTPTLYESMETKKAEDCSHKSCCSRNSPEVVTRAAPAVAPSKHDYHSMQSCCSNKISRPVTEFTIARVEDGCRKNCCSDKLAQPAAEASIIKADDCSKKICCSRGASKSTANVTNADDCLKEANCTDKVLISSCSSAGNIGAQLTSVDDATVVPATVPDIGIDNDIEKGLFQIEHLVLSVNGMTCTGCENKLYRSLDSVSAISNIKTSFLLSQAEFDLSGSTSIDSDSIIRAVEKMTGFTCTKMTQSGEELDIIVDGNAQEFAQEEDLPLGVTDLTVLNTNTIRVTYYPKIVGARDLLSTPFFRLTKLAPPMAPPLISSGRAHVRMSCSVTLLSALLTIPVLILAWAPLSKHDILYGAISLVLATIVQIIIAGPLYSGALKALIFLRMIEMDLLIVLSTTVAFVYSVIAYAYLIAGQPLSTGEFFETSTLLITLIMAGRAISAFARQKAVESISIQSLQISTAILIDPKTHQERQIDVRLLQYQDIFKVLPETSIATDGIVITGETEVDESLITGEATLVSKKPGMIVVAGSINHSSTLTVQLTRLPGENTIQAIRAMVDEAKSSKPRVQKIADRIAGYFVPIIFAITILVFVIWVVIGEPIRHQSVTNSCIVAMTYAISALIVSCPCAIGLAVPMVVVIAGGVGARHGLIFKSAETIEIARNVSHVIFDKTGTLTQGKLSVSAEEYLAEGFDSLAPIILGLTTNSKHPVSTAITTRMKALKVQPSQVENIVSVVGSGIEATCNGSIIRAGNPYWLGFQDAPIVHNMLSLGLTVFCASMDGELVAVFGLKDLLRLDATETINQLKKRSVKVSIVSGDNEEAVKSIARLLGIPESHVRFRCSPNDKQAYVKEMLDPKEGVVMFCGDGTNDAVALAQANIGIHMNEGTDIAQSAADVILMRPSLSGIITLMDLSKAFYRRVVFNFTWSFIYNVFAILLAAGAFPHARIPPQYAGLGEIVSVLPVIIIAMQLKWARFQGRN